MDIYSEKLFKEKKHMLTKEQFVGISEKYIDSVFRVALNYTKNPSDAQDITQTVYLRLLQQGKDFASEEHGKRWLLKVAVNECRKHFRSPWRKMESFEAYAQQLTFPSAQERELFYMVMELPEKNRLALYLYYYETYSTEEIAHIMGIPVGTVYSHLSRGRDLLRQQLVEGEEYV